jgi:hypothetical protein
MKSWVRLLVAATAACAAFAANAQILNFDEVCSTPPCNVGTAYQVSWGVTATPAALPIVAGGTNGLTGTNGARYLSVNAFPFQATIALPRTATFASLDVSRSSLTSAGQTFTLQPLNNGSPVGAPQTVTLGAVNAWTTVLVNVPGGFNGIFLDTAAGGADKTFGVDNLRLAGNCAGFNDVAPTDIFCNAAEWLYNRGVTTGCALGAYCPGNNVTRAQMALFMQRLGAAVSPVVLNGAAVVAGLDPSVATRICRVDHVPSVPQTAVPHAIGAMTGVAGTYLLNVDYSSDGGTTWTAVDSNYNQFTAETASSSAGASYTPIPLALQAGQRYAFAVRIGRLTGAAGNITALCRLNVQLLARTSTTAPFDAPDSRSNGPQVGSGPFGSGL